MSENTNPTADELIRNVTFSIQRSTTIPTPVDPTLSNEGEAADAKATGDAIAGVINNLRVNTKAPVSNAITIYGSDIAVTNDAGAQTVAQALESLAGTTANDIMYDSTNLVTVKAAIDGIIEDIDSELSEAEIDAIIEEVFGGEG